jgi:hemerythrin-like domain-containing protein
MSLLQICHGYTESRREFLRQGAALLTGAAAVSAAAGLLGCAPGEIKAEVPATEELMREHGLLRRLLLIYEEIARRLKCCQDFPAGALTDTTGLIRRVIQDHHEKLEEELIFPRFEKAGQMLALVKILRGQHEAGRRLVDQVRSQAGAAKNFVQQAQLEALLLLFPRLYRPHAAREDTVLFPALRSLMPPGEFLDLGKRLGETEQAHLGPGGLESVPAAVVDLEKTLGIHDLEQFTPKL